MPFQLTTVMSSSDLIIGITRMTLLTLTKFEENQGSHLQNFLIHPTLQSCN